MTITYAQLKNHVRHAIGGEPDSRISHRQIINEAGRHLFLMSAWNWRMRPPVSLSFTNGQSYVELPEDFGSLVAYEMADGLTGGIDFTVPQRLEEYRSTSVEVSTSYWLAAISYPSQVNETTGAGAPRLELYPTPGSAGTTLTIWYRSTWKHLDDDAQAANVPEFIESLLIDLCRAFALGREEPETGTLRERLLDVEAGPVAQHALEEDGIAQPTSGPIVNGHIDSMFTTAGLNYDTVADPE